MGTLTHRLAEDARTELKAKPVSLEPSGTSSDGGDFSDTEHDTNAGSSKVACKTALKPVESTYEETRAENIARNKEILANILGGNTGSSLLNVSGSRKARPKKKNGKAPIR